MNSPDSQSGDVNFAKWITKNRSNIKQTFNIYLTHCSNPYYIPYSDKSTYYDFFDQKGNRLY